MCTLLHFARAACALPNPAPQQQPPQLCTIPEPLPDEEAISVPSTFDSCELYWIYGPSLSQVPPEGAPLVVLFHGSYADHDEMATPGPCTNWGDYDFTSLATQNGWFVMMHDGGQIAPGTCGTNYAGCQPSSGNNSGGYWTRFGAEEFHLHTQHAIANVLCRYPINP